jgi:glucokinase
MSLKSVQKEKIVMLLAGDVGGTKTNLAIYTHEHGQHMPVVEGTFPSANYPSLEAIVLEFLSQIKLPGPLDHATFGVAGPVVNHSATITNLPWVMEETQLEQILHISSVRLLNDLEAIANAVPYLGLDDISTLNEGHAVPGGTIAVIAPGTGLGEAYLTWDGTKYLAHTSEGGHADFAPSNELEIEAPDEAYLIFIAFSKRVVTLLNRPN